MKTPNDLGLEPQAVESQPDTVGWAEALASFLSSRFGIFRIEAKNVSHQLIRTTIFGLAATGCALFGYAVLLAGAISLIARSADWSWDWVAMIVALLHISAAVVLVILAKPKLDGAFAVTRSEFEKDREWLKNFQNKQKSNG